MKDVMDTFNKYGSSEQHTVYTPLSQYSSTLAHKEFAQGEEEDLESAVLNKASWFSCYVCLANTIMGAGMLGLPYAFAKTGWLLGLILMIIFGASSCFSLHELSICAKMTEKPSSFYSVAMIAAPKWTWLIDVSICFKLFFVQFDYWSILL